MIGRIAAGLTAAVVRAAVAAAALWYTPVAALAAPLDVQQRIAVGAEPIGLAVAADGTVLATVVGDRTLIALTTPAAGAALTVTKTLDLSAHGRLGRVAVDQRTGQVYVSASLAGQLLQIDPALAGVTASFDGLSFPQSIVVTDDKVLVTETGGQDVRVLSLADLTERARIRTDGRPHRARLVPETGGVMVLHSRGRSIRFFDAGGVNTARGGLTWPNLRRPQDAAVVAGEVLVLDSAHDTLTVADLGRSTPKASFPLTAAACPDCGPFAAMALAVSPDGTAVAAVGRGGRMTVIATADKSILAEAVIGGDLREVVFLADNRLVVTSASTGEVIVVEGLSK